MKKLKLTDLEVSSFQTSESARITGGNTALLCLSEITCEQACHTEVTSCLPTKTCPNSGW